MKKTIIFLLAAVMLAGTVLAGCGGEKTVQNEGGEKTKITVSYTNTGDEWVQDDYYKYISDKVGVDIEFQSMPSDSAAEKARIMISSGSMTDVVYTNSFLPDEYVSYANQGVISALPDDWKTKYPNLGFSMEMTGALDMLQSTADGKIYGLLRPMDHYSFAIDDFRAAYNEGKDLREMMGEAKYRYIDKAGFAYRKDWAEQLGIKTDYLMEYDDFIDMVLKFKEADLGGVGAENVVGLAVDHTEAPNFFIKIHNPRYKYFHKDETDEYVCGLLEESTIDGVRAYAEAYKTGVLSKGFYTQSTQDLDSLFCSERSGVIFPKAEVSAFRTLSRNFEKANPGKLAKDCIDVCWVKSPDGTVTAAESSNYFGFYYLSPDITEEKLDKVLSLADYVASPEGGPQVRLGVPEVDYKPEGDDYAILREKNENGTYDGLEKKYPSYDFFRMFLNPCYSQSVETDPYARSRMDNLTNAKREGGLKLLEWDDARDGYAADDYVKFRAAYEVNSMFAEIVVSEGDPVENWMAKRAEIEKEAKSVLENMNKALIK